MKRRSETEWIKLFEKHHRSGLALTINTGNESVSFRSIVHNQVGKQILNNKAFFLGRTFFSVAQSYLFRKAGNINFRAAFPVVVSTFGVAGFGRALHLHSKGVTDSARLVSGVITGR